MLQSENFTNNLQKISLFLQAARVVVGHSHGINSPETLALDQSLRSLLYLRTIFEEKKGECHG